MLTSSAISYLKQAIDVMASAGRDYVPVDRVVLESLIAGAGMTTWLQYVPHIEVESYLAAGWVIEADLDDSHHGSYSMLMKWEGEGHPPKPVKVSHVVA